MIDTVGRSNLARPWDLSFCTSNNGTNYKPSNWGWQNWTTKVEGNWWNLIQWDSAKTATDDGVSDACPSKKTYFHDGFFNQLCDRLPERTSIYPEKTPLVTVDGASGGRTWKFDMKKDKKCRISSKLGSFFFQTKRLLRLAKKNKTTPKKKLLICPRYWPMVERPSWNHLSIRVSPKKGSNCCVNVLKCSPVFVFTNFDYCSIHHWKLIWRFWHMFFWWRKYFLLGSGQWARYDELHRVRSWKLQMYFKKIIQRYLFHPVWTYFWSWYKLIIFHNASLISLILKSGEAW